MPPAREEDRMRRDALRLADICTALQRHFMVNISKELTRGDVSFPQYFLLGFLATQGEMSMTKVAEKMGHTTAAATGLVDRLEKLGHVQRGHAANDRRKILVKITASGERIVREVRDDMVENLLKLMACLEPQEQRAWVQIYEKIITYCQCP